MGYNQEKKRTQYYYAGRKDLIDSNNAAINQATGDMSINGNMGQWAVNGLFARINYDFLGRYLLELNGRYDGSSKFKRIDTSSSHLYRLLGAYLKKDFGRI